MMSEKAEAELEHGIPRVVEDILAGGIVLSEQKSSVGNWSSEKELAVRRADGCAGRDPRLLWASAPQKAGCRGSAVGFRRRPALAFFFSRGLRGI